MFNWLGVRFVLDWDAGEIFRGVDVLSQDLVAIKTEKVNSKKQVLKLEVAVIKKLQGQEYFCQFIYCGRQGAINYVIMQLLGENLSDIRRKMGGKFSIATTARLTIQIIRALQAVHEAGYLHRDVKASNCAMGRTPSTAQRCYLIDFGLSRRYLLPNGEVRPARETTGFRGTARYASVNSHIGKELGRRDDLYSLLYVIVEWLKGNLPWRRIRAKEEIGQMKLKMRWTELLSNLPLEFLAFSGHLDSLGYQDKPDYDLLCSLMRKMCRRMQVSENEPYDWEKRYQLSDRSECSTTVDLGSSNLAPAGAAGAGNAVRLAPLPESSAAGPASSGTGPPVPAMHVVTATAGEGTAAPAAPAAPRRSDDVLADSGEGGDRNSMSDDGSGSTNSRFVSRQVTTASQASLASANASESRRGTATFGSLTSAFPTDFASLETMPTNAFTGSTGQPQAAPTTPLVGVATPPPPAAAPAALTATPAAAPAAAPANSTGSARGVRSSDRKTADESASESQTSSKRKSRNGVPLEAVVLEKSSSGHSLGPTTAGQPPPGSGTPASANGAGVQATPASAGGGTDAAHGVGTGAPTGQPAPPAHPPPAQDKKGCCVIV